MGYVVKEFPVKHDGKLYQAGDKIPVNEKQAKALGDLVVTEAEYDAKKNAAKAVTNIKDLQAANTKQAKEIEKLKKDNAKLIEENGNLNDENTKLKEAAQKTGGK